MITFIIQARLGSSRLPNKILLPFYQQESIFSLMIEKLKSIKNCKVIVATTDNERDLPLVQIAIEHNVSYFRGSENDVLKRFIDAAKEYKADKIIRVCSDNPFLDVNAIQQLVDHINNFDLDYCSFMVNGNPSIKTHFGFWTEYVTLSALEKVQQLTDEKLYHEHVTNYIYAHPESFKLGWIPADPAINGRNDIRLTIDTAIDFENAKEIYADLTKDHAFPTIEEIVNYLDVHNTFLKDMKDEIEKNSK